MRRLRRNGLRNRNNFGKFSSNQLERRDAGSGMKAGRGVQRPQKEQFA
jgi:hypothetical protein